MSDTTYQIFQDGQTYKVRITRLGEFVQEADGFSSYADAASWVAQDRRIAVIEEKGANAFGPSAGGLKDRGKAYRVVPIRGTLQVSRHWREKSPLL